MNYVPEGTDRCGFYECKICGNRFLDVRIGPSLICPYCSKEPDMELGPDDEMPVINESAKLLEMVEGAEQVEMYDQLLYVAFDADDASWL